MQTNLDNSWGLYPWFPELGNDLIAPGSLDAIKCVGPYGKLFNCIGMSGEYLRLRYRDQEFLVKPDLYTTVQAPGFTFSDEVEIIGSKKIGTIFDIEWHHKKAEPIFYLAFNGKKSSRRYFKSDFVPI